MARFGWLLEFALTAVLAISVFIAVGTAVYGSWEHFHAALSGRSVAIELVRLERGIGSEKANLATVAVQNLLLTEVKLLGSQFTCNCTMAIDLPRSLRPLERRQVLVAIGSTPGVRDVGMRLITDIRSEQPEVTIVIAR